MASQLPAIPRTIFTIIEPISLIAGAIGAFQDPDWFISEQIASSPSLTSPSSSSPSFSPSPEARLVALQLGNCYFLLMAVGVAVLTTTTELRVVRAYLVALALADISHVGLTIVGLPGGLSSMLEVETWNAMTMGNVGFTAFLFFARMAYFLGLFGPSLPAASGDKKKV